MLTDTQWPKSSPRPVHFLEANHVRQLEELPLKNANARAARDIVLLLATTGLDYPDLQAVLKNSGAYLRQRGDNQPAKLVGKRLKNRTYPTRYPCAPSPGTC